MDFERYKMDIPRPKKEDYTIVYVYDKGNVINKILRKDYHPADYPKSHIKQEVFDKEVYKAAMSAYYIREKGILELFKADLFKEFAVQDNPKRQKAFDLAWERGHSGGLQEVYGQFEELVCLIDNSF